MEVKFEIVPAFAFSSDSGYYYPDTNNGGSWRSMNPKKEIDSFNARNSICNGNLKRLCRMARAWNNCTVLLDGMTIDTVAFHFLNSYEYADKGFTYYDWLSRDFFKYLIDNSSKNEWEKPGNTGCTRNKYPFKRDAEEALRKQVQRWLISVNTIPTAGMRIGDPYMEPTSQSHRDGMYQQIQEAYGKLVYTYTCHLKCASRIDRRNRQFKWLPIGLSIITTRRILAVIFSSELL